jgi:hypothetical protein
MVFAVRDLYEGRVAPLGADLPVRGFFRTAFVPGDPARARGA